MLIEEAFTPFPVLTTERLILRQVVPADAPALFAVKGDRAITRAYAQPPHPSAEITRSWIERLGQSFQRREALFWGLAMIDGGPLIGTGGFWNIDAGSAFAELGYELGRDFQGQGLMSEAVRAMLDYGFGRMGLHRVEALPLEENSSSIRLLERLGFRQEGHLRQRIFFDGRRIDQRMYSLLAGEWR